MYKLYNGDCLEIMDRLIEEGIKVDCILTDPPYGTTACKWDTVIPFDEMWDRLNKLIKPNGAIVLFGQQPFSSNLISSNIKNFRYEIIWEKTKPVGFFNAKKMPLRNHENILFFYKKLPTYNPTLIDCNIKVKRPKNIGVYGENRNDIKNEYVMNKTGYPRSVINFSNVIKNTYHPTQKPTDLLEYLIKTYTNENETVLDFTMGSGSCGVACMNTNRKFIGIELDNNYFDIASKRIEEAFFNAQNKEGAINEEE